MPPLFSARTLLLICILVTLGLLFTNRIAEGLASFAITVVFWLMAGCPTVFRFRRFQFQWPRLRRRPKKWERIVMVVVPTLGGPRERDLSGCFGRLHPLWQKWLSGQAMTHRPDGSRAGALESRDSNIRAGENDCRTDVFAR